MDLPTNIPGIDTVVHSVCKLLGHLGAHPEYGKGVRAFPEYLSNLLDEAKEVGDSPSEEEEELKSAMSIKLARQVGSRYFVTSRNAGRILSLSKRATQFLEALKVTKDLNNLERDVLEHLKSAQVLALLKVDGLLFDQVYADLMLLLKSNELNKKYLDMNPHYLELSKHLQLLVSSPRLVLDPSIKVFTSESRLYGENKKINHRLHTNSKQVRACLYSHDDFDEKFTFPLIKKASQCMLDKLKAYKAEQLPGGKLWKPNQAVCNALGNIEPTNDLCEGILGLNDWIQKRTPNFSQRTVSAMVEVLKNSTMPWFCKQTTDVKDKIISLAKRRSEQVRKEEHALLESNRRKRKANRKAEEEKARTKRLKQIQKEEELSKIPIIATTTELEDALNDAPGTTAKQQQAAKMLIIKQQLEVRLHAKGKRLILSQKGRKKTVDDLLKELSIIMEEEESQTKASLPDNLVGSKLNHKLHDDSMNISEWYTGEVTCISEETISIKYEGYSDTFEWDKKEILEDIQNNDLLFLIH